MLTRLEKETFFDIFADDGKEQVGDEGTPNLCFDGIFIVTMSLNPVAKIINRLSIQQVQTSTFIKDFATKKNIEDIFGEVNLFLLLVYSAIYILSTSKPKM